MSQISIWLGNDSRCSFSLEWKIIALFVFFVPSVDYKERTIPHSFIFVLRAFYASWGSVIHYPERYKTIYKQTEPFPQTTSKQLNILVLQHENITTVLSSCHISWCFHVLTLIYYFSFCSLNLTIFSSLFDFFLQP